MPTSGGRPRVTLIDLAVTTADMVIQDASIWGSADTTIGIRGDRIVPAEVGPSTRVIKASGATVVPGFQDAHVHAPFAGLNMLRVWLNDAVDRGEYQQIIAEHVRSNPGSDWITGGGWAMSAFPGGNPHKADLDAIAPDRPVFLFNRDVHGAWVNSRALEIAGITATTRILPMAVSSVIRQPGAHRHAARRSGLCHVMSAWSRRRRRRSGAQPSSRVSATCIPSGSPPGRTHG